MMKIFTAPGAVFLDVGGVAEFTVAQALEMAERLRQSAVMAATQLACASDVVMPPLPALPVGVCA